MVESPTPSPASARATTPAGASVLFLHPVSLDSHAIDWLSIEGLTAPSLPGHGDRDRARPGVTLDDMADEIAGWTDGPVHLIGCSMGGMVALHFALRHPERTASLVIGYSPAKANPEIMRQRADETEHVGSAGMAEGTMRRWFTEAALSAEPPAAPVAYARERLLATRAETIADDWRAIAEHDVLDRLGELAGIPTTCIAGRRDLSTPLAAVKTLAAGIPGARLVVTDHPHMGFLEEPAEFDAIVAEHLALAGSAA
ncbi:MAG TPA: alpha/beta fold hydrolase [Gryllotalpicola sp.]